jgi:hypothetical protein
MKDRRSPFRTLLVAAVFLCLPLWLSACDDADFEFVAVMALDWAQGKGLITVGDCVAPDESDCTIEINYGPVVAARAQQAAKRSPLTAWAVDDPDPELIAAIDVAEVGINMEKAETLADEGLASGDVSKIDEAIRLRPGDWSYYDKKAAILTAQGNTAEADAAFNKAQSLVDDRVKDGQGSCQALQFNLLKNREQALLQQLQSQPNNQQLLDALDTTQGQLFYLETGHENSPCNA